MIHSCRWFTLPSSQRKLLRERRKLAQQLASLEVDNCTDWTFLWLEQTFWHILGISQGFVDLGISHQFVSARQASKMTPWNPNLVISRPAPKLALLDPPHFHQMLLRDAVRRLHPSQESAQQVLSQKFASKFRMANTSWRSRLFKTKSTCWSVKCGRSRRKDALRICIYDLWTYGYFRWFPQMGEYPEAISIRK